MNKTRDMQSNSSDIEYDDDIVRFTRQPDTNRIKHK